MGGMFLLAFLSLAPVWASRQDSAAHSETPLKQYVDADAYSIYAILLGAYKDPLFVIQAETQSSAKAAPRDWGMKGDSSFHKVWGPVLDDLAKKVRIPRLLTRDIPIEVSYEIVPQEKIEALFQSTTKTDRWGPFYELYPSSGGYFRFSAVGFDHQKTHAIVDLGLNCGMLCGHDEPHFFEKKNGKWREVHVRATFIVGAS